jgi:hypothetical protein
VRDKEPGCYPKSRLGESPSRRVRLAEAKTKEKPRFGRIFLPFVSLFLPLPLPKPLILLMRETADFPALEKNQWLSQTFLCHSAKAGIQDRRV